MKFYSLWTIVTLLTMFGAVCPALAENAPYFGLERNLTSKLTDDDVGRIFLLKINFRTNEGGSFNKGQAMVLQAVDSKNPFLYFCTPLGISGSREYKIREPQVIRTPFYEGTPPAAYSQLVMEIFASSDFFDKSKVKNSVNMKNRNEIQNNLDTFLMATPPSPETNSRIEAIQDILTQEDAVLEKIMYNKKNLINQKKADNAYRSSSSSSKSSSGSSCGSCPRGGLGISMQGFRNILNTPISRSNSSSSSSGSRGSTSLDKDEKIELVTDTLIPHLSNAYTKIDEVIASQDMLLAIAIFLHTENFADSVFAMMGLNPRTNEDYRDKRREMLELICLNMKNRFQDGAWQAKCQDFINLFPRVPLISKGRSPVSSNDLRILFDRAIVAYTEIYEFSAIANFENWGRAALDICFFIDGTPIGNEIENEYDINLDKYKKAQSTTKNNSGDASQPADNTDNN